MENQQNTAVVSLSSHKVNAQARIELDGVRRSQSMLSWDLQTQQVLMFSGLSISESLLVNDMPLPAHSSGAQLGHATLKDLVTRSESEHGLGMDWDDFSVKMMALVNRQKYSIQERDFNEINALVEDATVILGRKPADVGEFHGAKQRALQDQVVNIQREAALRNQSLTEKNADLMRNLTDTKAEISTLHEQNKALMQDGAERIASMTREMALNQEIFEQKSNERVTAEARRIQTEFDQTLARREAEISMRLREVENLKVMAESRYSDLQSRIDRGELVSSDEIKSAHRQLEESRQAESTLRNQLLDINSALTESQKQTQLLREENEEKSGTIVALNKHIEQMDARLRDMMEEKLGSSEFAVLHERLAMLRQDKAAIEEELRQVSLQNVKLGRQQNELRGRFQEMRKVGGDHLKALHAQNHVNQEKMMILASNLTKTKIALGVMTVLGLVSSAAFAAVTMGLV